MPFQSDRQRKFLFKKHPALARKWAEEYGTAVAKKRKRARKPKPASP
jgi:hypothetical protein